jgi:hypothetical protein
MPNEADLLREILDEADDTKQHWKTPSGQRDLLKLLQMVADRQLEALNLYQPLPFQERFHAATAKEVILSKGNQVGGSICGFAEVARAITGQDPHNKYPKSGGIAVCLGYGERHIGNVIHKYLFRWGSFEIIRDEVTGEWRVYRPWPKDVVRLGSPGDLDRRDEARPAPPLVPDRLMKNITWKKAGDRVFSMVTMKNRWEVYAYNSQGESEHAQGFQCNLWHIDEDVATDGWVNEAVGRLTRRKGLLRWTAMPHAKTDDIVMMLQRAEEEAVKPNPKTVVIYAGIDENPFLDDETKEENKRIWRSSGDEEYARRAEGRLIISSRRMYPHFDENVHNAIKKLDREEQQREDAGENLRCHAQKVLTETAGVPPFDWCRYLSIDPGYTIGAGVFLARPPSGEFYIAYDELYIPNCTASIFAEAVQNRWNGDPIQEFIFDFHGGKLRSLGTAEVPVEVYEKEFASHGLVCQARGSKFAPGSDDVKARELALRELLIPRVGHWKHQGLPKFFVVVQNCPNLCRELKNFKRKMAKVGKRDVVLDQGDRRSGTHAVECVEMLAAHGMPYVKPERKVVKVSSAERVLQMNQRFKNLHRSSIGATISGINLGPRGV